MAHDLRFWLAFWLAADASRAYRAAAEDWRAAGSDDYAEALDAAALDHDAQWDAKLRAHWASR